MVEYIPMDGDTFVTKENFIFYVFGYEHPENRVFSFLKYIPIQLRNLFSMRFLDREWRLREIVLVRPEKLYDVKNFRNIMKVFRDRYPHYIHFCPFRGKTILSSPKEFIRKIYSPKKCLRELLVREKKDQLQELAADFTRLLSKESRISLNDFGIRGSIALDMHSQKSDIDLVVYGTKNFRQFESTIDKLECEGVVTRVFTTMIDRLRKNKGRYKDVIFMVNAARNRDEVKTTYGEYSYTPVKSVDFSCKVADDTEAMFRPAIYQIEDYSPLNSHSKLRDGEAPKKAVSMIGYYRNIARKGDWLDISGMLEKVENIKTGEINYQVVVGTGKQEDEHIWVQTQS